MQIPQKKFWINMIFVILFVSGILLLSGNRGVVKANTKEIYKNIEVFAEVLKIIEKKYVEAQDPKELISGAINGMVSSLDPHSSFMKKEEHQELMMETNGSFTGIGIEITTKNGFLTVVSPIEGTPAYDAGIEAGDQILMIEDKFTKKISMMEAVKKIRGPKGSQIKLTIGRNGEKSPLEFVITRGVIPLKSVRSHLLAPGLGYLRVSNFRSNTFSDIISSLDKMEKERPLEGLVMDLRNNPGGLLDQSIKISDIFLDKGVIVSTKGRDPYQNKIEYASKNKTPRGYPIIILINGGSASASEIVAGALQDNKRAIIIGSRSFGKGSVQTIMPLSDGSGLRLTTARYYTPSGRSIQLDGIIPDIELAFIPPQKKEKEDQKIHFFREEDLDHAIPNESVKKEKQEPEKIDQKVKLLLEKDNQVRYALELMKSWEIFSRINGGQENKQL